MSDVDVKLTNLGRKIFAVDFSDSEVLECMKTLLNCEMYLRELRLKYPRKKQ